MYLVEAVSEQLAGDGTGLLSLKVILRIGLQIEVLQRITLETCMSLVRRLRVTGISIRRACAGGIRAAWHAHHVRE